MTQKSKSPCGDPGGGAAHRAQERDQPKRQDHNDNPKVCQPSPNCNDKELICIWVVPGDLEIVAVRALDRGLMKVAERTAAFLLGLEAIEYLAAHPQTEGAPPVA